MLLLIGSFLVAAFAAGEHSLAMDSQLCRAHRHQHVAVFVGGVVISIMRILEVRHPVPNSVTIIEGAY